MSTATFKGYKDGTPSAGVATRYGDDRTYLELPIGVPVEVEKDALAAVKKLADEKGPGEKGEPGGGELVYDIAIDTKASSPPGDGAAGGRS